MSQDRFLPVSWLVVAFTIMIAATACAKKEDTSTKRQGTIKAEVKAESKPVPSVSEAMSAFFRAHPNSDRVCYDSNYDAFLVHYRDLTTDEINKPVDRYWGWYFVQQVQFYKLANNTWFTGIQPEERYIRAYPNVIGLPCQEIRD